MYLHTNIPLLTLLVASIFAFALSSILVTSAWPLLAAKRRGVLPSWSKYYYQRKYCITYDCQQHYVKYYTLINKYHSITYNVKPYIISSSIIKWLRVIKSTRERTRKIKKITICRINSKRLRDWVKDRDRDRDIDREKERLIWREIEWERSKKSKN